MRINTDVSVEKLKLSQVKYVEKVMEKFNMNEIKPMSIPLASHTLDYPRFNCKRLKRRKST